MAASTHSASPGLQSLTAGHRVDSQVSVTVAVDPVALVVTECITVTSAMRKHARWAHSSVSAILGGGEHLARFEAPKPSAARRKSLEKREKLAAEDSKPSGLRDDTSLSGRWGLRGKKGQSLQDNPLLSAFARLRSDLKACKDIYTVSAPTILHPFLQVIRSSSTSAPITSLALIAITKFFAYKIISHNSPQLPLAMQLLSSAVTHCRFEASDSATDEIVLFRILKLMEGMITGPAGDVLGDESMCEMMETGISMCCQVRLSELLRRSAEVSMVTMCQTIFQRLKSLEVEDEAEDEAGALALGKLTSNKEDPTAASAAADNVKMEPAIDGNLLSDVAVAASANTSTTNLLASNGSNEDTARDSQSLEEQNRDGAVSAAGNAENAKAADAAAPGTTKDPNGVAQIDSKSQTSDTEAPVEIKPYSLPSIRELFRVLVNLLDPHDKQHNDTMRVMALRIVDVALEVAGPSIASHPSLANLAKDTLCRHLFQLVRSENIAILNESLRVAGTLLSTCRRVLKLQQELFLSYVVACLHPRVEIPTEPGIDAALYEGVPHAPRPGSGRATPVPVRDRQKLGMEGGMRKPDAREAMVESVGALVRMSSFMAELFVNYDCEIDRRDLCIDMVGLLSRNAFPDAATWSTTNVPPLCLDALLGYVQSIAERLDDEPVSEGLPSLEQLAEQRNMKQIIIEGASKFNENPKSGLEFLAARGVIKAADDAASVARFLRGTTLVDKKIMGEYLPKKNNSELLSAFMETFDFSGLRVDEALRSLLNTFRLPGEAPLIERFVNIFSDRYFDSAADKNVADRDAVYVLTYAIIILNTDQHNPNVKGQKRMTPTDFARNLRGVNNKGDFDPDYLQEIFDSIKTREIILAEEHDNKNAFDHAWKELLVKVQSTSNLQICQTNLYDPDMFAATWKPVVATLSYVFMSATDDTVFARVVTGFDQCAQIATRYNLHEALDHIIFCLSSISTLAAPSLPSTSLNTEIQTQEKNIMVSETAVRFGRDFKAQLATVVLFRVVIGHESAIRDGWTHLVRILLNLFVNSLINSSYASLTSYDDLPAIPLHSPAKAIEREERASEGGLFSAFTSYVSSFANDEPPEPSDQEIEYTLCTVDCVTACNFEDLFANISQLPVDGMKSLVMTLLAQIPEDGSPRVIAVKPELPAPTPVRPNGQKPKAHTLAYDPSLVFVLETCTLLASQNGDTLASFGKEVADALQTIVRDPTHVHPVTLSRTVYYLLSFLQASHDYDFIRAPVVLHTISKFDPELMKQSAVYISKGLQSCLKSASGLRNEILNTPDFWNVLRALQAVEETAADVFNIVTNMVDGPAPALTVDNYEAVSSLLNDIATAGSVGAVEEQQYDQTPKKGKSAKTKPKPSEAVIRGQRAMQITYQITTKVPYFIEQSQLEPEEAWKTYWSPPFRTLTTHSLNPCRVIRQQALASLQRVLLSPTLALHDIEKLRGEVPKEVIQQHCTVLFTDVLFPLLTQLLKPEVWHSDPGGMDETRLQAAVLSCKLFLRFLDTLLDPSFNATSGPDSDPVGILSPAPSPANAKDGPPAHQQPRKASDAIGEEASRVDGVLIWARILQILERLFKSGGSNDGLEEAVPESLKNIVLVMVNGNYLEPPGAPGFLDPMSVGGKQSSQKGGDQEEEEEEAVRALKKRMWRVTWDRMERFLPGFMADVFPGATKDGLESKAVSPAPTPAPPSAPAPAPAPASAPAPPGLESAQPRPPDASEDASSEGSVEDTVIRHEVDRSVEAGAPDDYDEDEDEDEGDEDGDEDDEELVEVEPDVGMPARREKVAGKDD